MSLPTARHQHATSGTNGRGWGTQATEIAPRTAAATLIIMDGSIKPAAVRGVRSMARTAARSRAAQGFPQSRPLMAIILA